MKPLAPRAEQLADATPDTPADTRQWLSALADGDLQGDPQTGVQTGVQTGAQASAQAMLRACTLWRSSAQARQAWHTYHLIGDVLRSEELAGSPARDAAFLAGLRARLAAEPVVMAPAPVSATVPPTRRRLVWLAPSAVAAGFVVAAAALVVARTGLTGAPTVGAVQALAPAASSNLALAGVPAARLPAAQGAALIRDARLDSYLRAHQAARGGGAGVPGGGLRSVEVILPADAQR